MRFLRFRTVLVPLILAVILINSCEEIDELPPEIEVIFPSAGATYQVPDSVVVGLEVTDDTELTNLEVKIIGPSNVLASTVASIDPSGSRFEGALTVVLSDKYLPSGE